MLERIVQVLVRVLTLFQGANAARVVGAGTLGWMSLMGWPNAMHAQYIATSADNICAGEVVNMYINVAPWYPTPQMQIPMSGSLPGCPNICSTGQARRRFLW